jgi:hypothetical protein
MVSVEAMGQALDEIDAQFPGITAGTHDARVYARRIQARVESLGAGLCFPACRGGRGCGSDCELFEDLLARAPRQTFAESRRLAAHRALAFHCARDSPCRALSKS